MIRPNLRKAAVILMTALGWMAAATAPLTAGEIKLLFTFGSEKESWLKDVTAKFNAKQVPTADGDTISVELMPMGSGQCIDTILDGSRKPHLTSPASDAFIVIGNSKSADLAEKTGGKVDAQIVKKTQSLVKSPIVIAMWKDMAEAIGYPKRQIGWNDLTDLIEEMEKAEGTDKAGWGVRGHPEWGAFKFAHTHPELSNSGLLALIAIAYAGVDKNKNLTAEDLNFPAIRRILARIQCSVLFYGESTGFLGKSMYARGPENISAAVLYENMVIDSYDPKNKSPKPIVAIYPREGTFMSDHPVGVVNRPWVTKAHEAAARQYIDYLLTEECQKAAMRHGFRPGVEGIPLDRSKFKRELGVDPDQPKRVFESPKRSVMEAMIELWRANRKSTRLVLAIDTSFSMNRGGRIEKAREGAVQMIEGLGDTDTLSLMTFNSKVAVVLKDVPLKTGRAEIIKKIKDIRAEKSTALYDAVIEAMEIARPDAAPATCSSINAIILLSDGVDVTSDNNRAKMLEVITPTNKKQVPLIFTIAYGQPTDDDPPEFDLLKKIADLTRAKYYDKVDPKGIKKVLADLNAFFGARVVEP